MTQLRRCIATHAPQSDFAPTSSSLLRKLGYDLVPAALAEAPEVRIAREEQVDQVPEREIPVIALAGRKRMPRGDDPRVVGTVKRPAGLHELYRLLQLSLESHPRALPRVECDLAAHAQAANGDQYDLRVESLSANGCLVTGPKLPPLETALTIRIEMPWGERITVPGDVAYERREQRGLVFHGITVQNQRKLGKLVLKLLERL
jgi:hypothetical protein